jgi:UDP-glucose 4-epimerase|tara:strand:+ start:1540 stop:2442 length:903 start_codon:yes stop_codon:yes gene_type:complete
MKKILVTGGAGFIGSHLVERLLELDDENKVLVLDNFSTGKTDNLPVHRNIIIEDLDILGFPDIFFENIDVVYHLAALTRPRESFINPAETIRVNMEGTLNIIQHCIKYEVKKLVYVSSASVYGHQLNYPNDEYARTKPKSPYAVTKLAGEMLLETFKDLDYDIVRPFNVYGKRQDPSGPYGAAVPKFIDALKNGKQPYITGDGSQFRDFIYIEDLVDLLVTVGIDNYLTLSDVFNAGSGQPTTINTLYNKIGFVMDKKVEPKYVEAVDDPNTHANIGKAESLLGWKPKHSLIEGLTKTIQ